MGLGQSTRELLEEVDSQTEWGEAMFVLFGVLWNFIT
jgi:hypothetical protein